MTSGQPAAGRAARRAPRTLLEKIWDRHVVCREPGFPAVLYVDLHLIHEVTSRLAFLMLKHRGLKVRRPERTVAFVDHVITTGDRSRGLGSPSAVKLISVLERAARQHGIRLLGPGSESQGIVHVAGPELGLTHPGMTVVCGDSHTSTHGALGALAFGVGTTEVAHVLATQCLLMRRPKSFEVRFEGRRGTFVTAKDLVLALAARLGPGGGAGHVFEYRGDAACRLTMEERLTVCNMSVEAGARAGMFAPDDVTFEYLAGREGAPRGQAWEEALARWRRLPTDGGATFDRSVTIDVSRLEPMVTWGTRPGMAIPIDGRVPDPGNETDAEERRAAERALRYMALAPGRSLLGQPIDAVFLGSCTNSRLSDLRAAAGILDGRKVHQRVRMLVVPGSRRVRRDAEAEGLDLVFRQAGAEWREPGCSLCLSLNDDVLEPGQRCLATSNRSFEGRQGRGVRTHLASPETAAASAVAGAVADPRVLA